jgi:hypothetical protein
LPATRTITATPYAGYTFSQWTRESGECTINNAYTANTTTTLLTATNCVLKAHFTAIPSNTEGDGTSPVVVEGTETPLDNQEIPGTVTPETTNETKAFWKKSGIKLLLGIIILAVLITGTVVGVKKVKKNKSKSLDSVAKEREKKYEEYLAKLNTYVVDMRKRGFKDEEIKASLQKSGTNPRLIDIVLRRKT